MHSFVSKNNLEAQQFLEFETWVIILTLSILVGLILVGIVVIYIYYEKMIVLLKQQQSFINGFTHELKTPVASLRLFLDTFAKHELPREDFLNYIQMMKQDTERLSDNIEQILSLARLEDKKAREEFIAQDIYAFTSALVERTSHLFEKLDINIIEPPRKAYCNFSPVLLEMLILNIISNAARYNENDFPKVTISFKIKYRNIDITFSDNGIGLDRKQFKKVFKKFYQVQNTAKGSGIGLYMAKMIAKLHYGDIKATSPGVGLGTTLTLTLPMVGKDE